MLEKKIAIVILEAKQKETNKRIVLGRVCIHIWSTQNTTSTELYTYE